MLYDLLSLGGGAVGGGQELSVIPRACLAAATSLLVCLALGRPTIAWLKRLNLREKTEKTPIEDEELRRRISAKSGTPTMGGLMILAGLLVACLLWADAGSRYVQVTLMCALALSVLGLADDQLKLRGSRHVDRGLKIRHKAAYQLVVGGSVGLLLWARTGTWAPNGLLRMAGVGAVVGSAAWGMAVLFAASNGTNFTDGLDGLLAGLAPMAAVVLAAACWAAGNQPVAARLGMPYVAGAGELTVCCAALAGACLGFLCFNRYPASVFMGDVGSLAVGGTLAAAALAARQELLLAVIGLVFLAEFGSSALQVVGFKLSRRRILPIAPVHHIFQKQGHAEPRIVRGFYLAGAAAALAGVGLICL